MKQVCSFFVFLLWAVACGAQERVLVIRSADKVVEIPLSKIATLPQSEYVAVLPGIDDKPHRARGPLLRDVLALADVTGDVLQVVGYDRYKAEIPITDLDAFQVLAAREVDGKPLTLRDKGPLWIVYPSEAHPELRFNPIYEARSVWQVKEISVR
jgi:hypothetical protein